MYIDEAVPVGVKLAEVLFQSGERLPPHPLLTTRGPPSLSNRVKPNLGFKNRFWCQKQTKEFQAPISIGIGASFVRESGMTGG